MKVDETVNISFDKQLTDSIEVEKVGGGDDTNPMWTSEIGNVEFEGALKQSLQSFYLLAKTSHPAYELSATLMEVEQPLFGLNLEVTATVRYILVEKSSNKIIFDETIKTPYTATFGDAFAAAKRLRLANEGAAKTNITRFLEKLSELKIDKSDIDVINNQ